jgi:hypothetical protein
MTMTTHVMGPHSMRLLDTLAGLLLEGGAQVRAAAWGVDIVLAYVVATAVEHAGGDEGDDSELDGLRQRVATLDASVHPHLAKLGAELVSGEGPQRFRWGLNVLVNGILNSGA